MTPLQYNRRPTTGDLRAAGFVRLSVVRASSNELRASSNECLATSRGQRAAAVVASEKALDAWANKPMVPTAPGALTEPARRSRRRHIGEPLDSSGQPVSGSAHWILD